MEEVEELFQALNNTGIKLGFGGDVCTNIKFFKESGYEVWKAAKYGYGSLLYRIEVSEDEDNTCEAGVSR